jgi:Peptidase C13 family
MQAPHAAAQARGKLKATMAVWLRKEAVLAIHDRQEAEHGGSAGVRDEDGRTLMIAAARKDRRSFACRDDNGFTYFSRAYFKDSLPKTVSFEDAFQRAEVLIRDWELRRASIAAFSGSNPRRSSDEQPSVPQISTSPAIEAHLRRWWTESLGRRDYARAAE